MPATGHLIFTLLLNTAMATSTQGSLMGLPSEIRQIILLEVFDDEHMTIQLQSHKNIFTPSFDIAPLLVCKNMRSEALTVLMRGIELRIDTLCFLEEVQLLPADIRRCIRYLCTTYDHFCCGYTDPPDYGWLDPAVLVQLPNLESVYIDDCGEHSCEVSTAESIEDLRAEIQNGDAADDIYEYLWDSNHIDMDSTSQLDRAVVIHVKTLLSISWDEAFEDERANGEGYVDVSNLVTPGAITDVYLGCCNLSQQR